MGNKIKIRVFDTLKSNNVMVSGWFSYKDNPDRKYGLFTGTTDGLEDERRVYCKKFMKPEVWIPSTNLYEICIKVRHRDRDLAYSHIYRDWNEDICIGWLRPGNLGGDTVNWFFKGESDCWHYGGEKGDPLVSSHRADCGNIPLSIGKGSPSFSTSSSSRPAISPATRLVAYGRRKILTGIRNRPVLVSPTVDSVIERLTKDATHLVDGSDTVPILPENMERDREGAYIRGMRTEQLNVVRFVFPANTSNYYLGNILLKSDIESFFSNSPIALRFSPNQRKPLSFVPSVVMDDFSMLKNVSPTEMNVKLAMDRFLIKYKSWVKQHNFRLPEVASPKYYNFESKEGINIGGTIKGVNFGASLFSSARSITVVEFKQVLFSVSIDDVYEKGSDFLQNITVGELQSKCTIGGILYPPAIIETVYYGKAAYLCAVCEDKEKASFDIGEYVKTGKSCGSSKWKLQVIVNGGRDNFPSGYLDRKNLQELINSMTTPLQADDIETAVPVEFEASYMYAPSSNPVRLDIKPYYLRYVEEVSFTLKEHNKGAGMSAIIRWVEPRLDAGNNWRYVFYEQKKKKLDHTVRMSPWALAIEVKIDVTGAVDKYDFNFFIPNLPLDLLRVNDDGECEIQCNITGATVFDTKNVTISPMPSGCYFSKDNDIYGVVGMCSYFQTQQEILREFFRWCEYQEFNSSQMRPVGRERKDKSGQSRD